MNVHHATIVALFASIPFAGCGSTSEDTTNKVTQWLGESPHLAISGTYQDKTYDVRLEGDAASGIHCQRFYAPITPNLAPGPDGTYDTTQVPLYFVMKELGGVIQLEGQPIEFTISYWRHDVPAGTDTPIMPRTFGTSIPEGKTWSDVNLWVTGTDPLANESAATSGTVSMKLNSGTPDSNSANGVYVPNGGRTGMFISASWGPHDNLNVSATADCGNDVIALWPQSRILP